jgi:hypothetical protein
VWIEARSLNPEERVRKGGYHLKVQQPLRAIMTLGSLLALLFISSGCASSPNSQQATATAPPSVSFTPYPSAPVPASLTPTPISGLLDPAPTNCPASPPLHTMKLPDNFGGGFTGGNPFQGASPVWQDSFWPGETYNFNADGFRPLPGTKVMWVVGPN